MISKKTQLLLAGALAVSSLSGTANAATIYGGGASLPAPFVRIAADCYGAKSDLLNRAGSADTLADFNFAPVSGLPFNCAVATIFPGDDIRYISTGSGRGIAGFYSHSNSASATFPAYPAGTAFPAADGVQFAFSETALGAGEIGRYNNGGTQNGVTVVAPGVTPTGTNFANPAEKYGAAIQLPAVVAPVTIAYQPVYGRKRLSDGTILDLQLNLKFKRPVSSASAGSGGLRLDAVTYCKIFNGQITNWNDPALKALNGNVSLKDPQDTSATFDVPMQIVGRKDSSGTTSLWTRHLAKACGDLQTAGTITGNNYADSSGTLPGALIGAGDYAKATDTFTTAEVVGKYTIAEGSDGVAKVMRSTIADPSATVGDISRAPKLRIGYLGPDWVKPAVVNTPNLDYNLHTASLKYVGTAFIEPNVTNTSAAFATVLPPQSTITTPGKTNGKYIATGGTPGTRANPEDWVQAASKTAPLAGPLKGYPIVGTSNMLLYTCYADTADRNAVVRFVQMFFGQLKKDSTGATINAKILTDLKAGILAKSGFAALPAAWSTAINETFLSKSTLGNNPGALNLWIVDTFAPKAPAVTNSNPNCAGKIGA